MSSSVVLYFFSLYHAWIFFPIFLPDVEWGIIMEYHQLDLGSEHNLFLYGGEGWLPWDDPILKYLGIDGN